MSHALSTPCVCAQDRAFIALLNVFRPHGGLVRLQSLNTEQRTRCAGSACEVRRLVETGELFSFQWHDAAWTPAFQFDMPGPRVAAGPQRVVAELGRDFDGWALATWFAQPNDWLASHSPIECLASRLPEVLEAARADRFVVAG